MYFKWYLGDVICVKHFCEKGAGGLWMTSIGEKAIGGKDNFGGMF